MARQTELAGVEHPNGDEELDALAEAFKKSSKKRKAAQDAEFDARSVLVDALKKKKLTVYEDRRVDPPLLVTLTVTEKVKVAAIDEIAGDDEDGEEVRVVEAPIEQRASKKKLAAVGE